jgi:hypothetical protein
MDTYTSKADISVNLLAAATDEGLVAAAKLGAHAAFMELWTRHSNTAFKMAYRIDKQKNCLLARIRQLHLEREATAKEH